MFILNDGRSSDFSELGLATHFVDPSSFSDILLQITQLDNPSSSLISSIVASHSPPPPPAKSPSSSREYPDGPCPITGDIREFLDNTFNLESIADIHAALGKAEEIDSLSDGVKAWAKTQKEMMDMRSPTGMAVALEGFRRARQAHRLDETLQNGGRSASCRLYTAHKRQICPWRRLSPWVLLINHH